MVLNIDYNFVGLNDVKKIKHMWYVIIAILIIVLVKFFYDQNKQKVIIAKQGGMRNKYRALVDNLLNEDVNARILSERGDCISIGLNNLLGSTIYTLTQTFRTVTIQWKTQSLIYGNHNLEWEFDEYDSQMKMITKINNDVAKYQNNLINSKTSLIGNDSDTVVDNAKVEIKDTLGIDISEQQINELSDIVLTGGDFKGKIEEIKRNKRVADFKEEFKNDFSDSEMDQLIKVIEVKGDLNAAIDEVLLNRKVAERRKKSVDNAESIFKNMFGAPIESYEGKGMLLPLGFILGEELDTLSIDKNLHKHDEADLIKFVPLMPMELMGCKLMQIKILEELPPYLKSIVFVEYELEILFNEVSYISMLTNLEKSVIQLKDCRKQVDFHDVTYFINDDERIEVGWNKVNGIACITCIKTAG